MYGRSLFFLFLCLFFVLFCFACLFVCLFVLYLSEDNNSYQSSLLAASEAAMFIDKHEGILRHSKLQSKMSYTVNVPTIGTFRE